MGNATSRIVKIAEFYKSSKGAFLHIGAIDTLSHTRIDRQSPVPVTGKREARKLALDAGAKPWNF